jgi:hypothetical protein
VFSEGACDKLKALVAGGVQAVSTVPWHVTADGISHWEGGCSFTKITRGKRLDEWHIVAACQEEDDESTESYIFRRTRPGEFAVTLTTPGISAEEARPLRYTRCDVGPIPAPQ